MQKKFIKYSREVIIVIFKKTVATRREQLLKTSYEICFEVSIAPLTAADPQILMHRRNNICH